MSLTTGDGKQVQIHQAPSLRNLAPGEVVQHANGSLAVAVGSPHVAPSAQFVAGGMGYAPNMSAASMFAHTHQAGVYGHPSTYPNSGWKGYPHCRAPSSHFGVPPLPPRYPPY
jgi:hypothetical protein